MENKKQGKFRKQLLDSNYDLEKWYFIKELSTIQWNSIKEYLTNFISAGKVDENSLTTFFANFPELKKGKKNL